MLSGWLELLDKIVKKREKLVVTSIRKKLGEVKLDSKIIERRHKDAPFKRVNIYIEGERQVKTSKLIGKEK